MATKAIVKLLKAVTKNDSRSAADIGTDLGLSAEDYALVLDGSLEISPALAVKLEKVFGVEALDVLTAQSQDQLETLGHKRVEKVAVEATTKKATGTDGRPSQSPMHRERGVLSISLPAGLSDEQANKAVRAVMDSFAE